MPQKQTSISSTESKANAMILLYMSICGKYMDEIAYLLRCSLRSMEPIKGNSGIVRD